MTKEEALKQFAELGAAFVFFMRDGMPPRLQKALPGFASGVMVAASVW